MVKKGISACAASKLINRDETASVIIYYTGDGGGEGDRG